MVPAALDVKFLSTLHPFARALCCLAISMLAAVFLVPLIADQGIGSYYVALVAVTVLSIACLFGSSQTEIKPKPEVEANENIRSSPIKSTGIDVNSTKKLEVDLGQEAVEQVISPKLGSAREDALCKLTHGEKEFLAPYIFQEFITNKLIFRISFRNILNGLTSSRSII